VVALFADQAATLADALQRLTEQSRQIASVRHPAIGRVLRLFLANGTLCVVSEYESGPSLAEWQAQNGAVDQKRLLAILLPLLDGLAAMHRLALVHGAIRPSQVRLRSDLSPVLLAPGANLALPETNNGEPLGAIWPGYAPIESYFANARLTPASDLYALAALACTLISGVPPLEAPRRLLGERLPSLAEHANASAFAPALLQLLDQALSLDPAARPQQATAFRQALVSATAATDPAPTIAGEASFPATGIALDAGTLSEIQRLLAERIGPIASVVLKKAMAGANDWGSLTAGLTVHLPEESVQRQFLLQLAHLAPQTAEIAQSLPAEATPVVATAHNNFDPELLRQLESELANQIGAIARIVVKRCATRASDRDELVRMLADEIGDPALSKRFLAWAGATFAA